MEILGFILVVAMGLAVGKVVVNVLIHIGEEVIATVPPVAKAVIGVLAIIVFLSFVGAMGPAR